MKVMKYRVYSRVSLVVWYEDTWYKGMGMAQDILGWMEGCVITPFSSRGRWKWQDTSSSHKWTSPLIPAHPPSQLEAVGRHSAASAMPGLTVILHPLPCLPSDLASGQCQWPGPRSIDLCFRFSAEAWEALGQWATVCSLQQLSPEFRRDRAGPAGRVRQEPCSRPAQGHREPGALWWRSCSAAVRPAALHHPAVIITCTRKTTKYKFTIDSLLRSINPAIPLMTDDPSMIP